MKTRLLITNFLFFSITWISSAQNNSFEIGSIKVTSIGFHKAVENHFYDKIPDRLLYILLMRENDSVSYAIAQYENEDSMEFFKLARKRKFKFETKLFDEYVQLLKTIDPKELEENRKTINGYRYKISFGDGKWQTVLNTDEDLTSNESYEHFFTLFNLVWNRFKDNVAQQRL